MGSHLVTGEGGLSLLPLSGGPSRQLLRTEADTRPGNMISVTFTPDSKHVAFDGTVHGQYGLWLIPVEGGPPRRVNMEAKAISALRFNPKTWQIVYAPSNAPSFEVRRMENFLPGHATNSSQRAVAK